MKKKPIQLLIADDHTLVRNALVRMIKSFIPSTHLYEASNGQEAIEIIGSTAIDLVLLDMQMPVLNGIETMKRIKDLQVRPYVLILTQFDDQALVTNMLHLGANGFLVKDCCPEELIRAILSILEMGYFVNELTSKVIHSNLTKHNDLASIEISAREMEVMILLKDGKSSKEIASKLNLTLHTIESYRKALMKKTHCKNVADVVSLAYRTGMVPLHI